MMHIGSRVKKTYFCLREILKQKKMKQKLMIELVSYKTDNITKINKICLLLQCIRYNTARTSKTERFLIINAMNKKLSIGQNIVSTLFCNSDFSLFTLYFQVEMV